MTSDRFTIRHRDRQLDPKEEQCYGVYADWMEGLGLEPADPETWRLTTQQIKGGGGVDAP